jgi:hypothetical protein
MLSGNASHLVISELEQWQVELRLLLEDTTVLALRQGARLWGWTLKGTAKSEIVGQMASHLGDTSRMAAAIQTVPEEELTVLGWAVALGPLSVSKQLQAAMAEGSGIRISQKAVDAHLQSLIARCLIFPSVYFSYRIPELYRLWLPNLATSKLLFAVSDRLQPSNPVTVVDIVQMAQRLLSAVTADHPPATIVTRQTLRETILKGALLDPRRPSLVTAETLARWGFDAPAERQIARFLLEQLTNSRLCLLSPQPDAPRLAPATAEIELWDMASMSERLQRLRRAYLIEPGNDAAQRLSSWSEWDMVFTPGSDDGLTPGQYWISNDLVVQQIQRLGVWLNNLLIGLPADTWFSVEGFCRLIYQVRRDLQIPSLHTARWMWVIQGEELDAQQLPFDRWRQSFGRLVEAWLTGPASWLLWAQVGYAAGRPVAFQRPSALPLGVAEPAPPGSLRFMADGAIGLENDWRVSELRRLLRWISVEVARDARTTLLRLDAGAFRRALYAGQTAATVGEAFGAAGFPLSAEAAEMLQVWQSRFGRYQLYEQMTVVEFGEDVLIEELRAISRLSNAEFYQPAARYLIFPDPQIATRLVEDLRRRGYTPQVLP